MKKCFTDAFKSMQKDAGYPNLPIRPFHSKIMVLSKTIDSLAMFACLWTATYIYSVSWEESYTWSAVAGLLIFQYLSEHNEAYEIWRGSPICGEAIRIFVLWFFTAVILSLIIYFSVDVPVYYNQVMLVWYVITPVVITLLHLLRRRFLMFLRSRNRNIRKVAVLGVRTLGKQVASSIQSMPWLGYRFVGYYDDRSAQTGRRLDDTEMNVIGDFDDLIKNARSGQVDVVYVVLPMSAEKRISELVRKLADSTVSVYIVPDFFMFGLLHARWSTLKGIPTVSVYESPFFGLDGFTKRFEDIVLSLLILTVIAIPMLIIAILIKLTSPGPVIFKQRRYGIRGDEITVWKFRSMRVTEDDGKVVQAKKNDSRATPIGAFLRRTSLDELPQFINVLQGRMSVVGPRPHAVSHNEEYRPLIQGYMLRHKVKPGITGWAQINGFRGETDTLDKMEQRVKYDLDYIRNWTLWFDLQITFMTVFKGFIGKNVF